MKSLHKFSIHYKKTASRSLALLTLLCCALSPISTYAQASSDCRGYGCYSEGAQRSLGIYFANDPYQCDTSSDTVSATGATPPYILEEFMIDVIKNIAKKRGVDPTPLITEEHVVALVAFAIGEGGDINNRFLFNPLNTGIDAPDLLAPGWEHNTSGLQAFRSYDAGVEALGRVMTGDNQSRLADTLTNKNSNAQQFMEALTYFNRYPGNKLWAEASLPPNTQKYYNERLSLIQQVRSSYRTTAALIIGTNKFEQPEHMYKASKLRFNPGGQAPATTTSTTVTTANTGCGDDGATSGPSDGSKEAIKNSIIKFAWPSYMGRGYMTMKPAYKKYMSTAKYTGDCGGVDCGAFVTAVMRDSGADPTYNKSNCNTRCQLNYLLANSGTGKKYTHLPANAKLEPFDIAVQYNGIRHHTYIYVGKMTYTKTENGVTKELDWGGSSASASQCSRAPMASGTDDPEAFEWFRLNNTQ